jgi:indolepyruvate ferredoxin oxidoreductase beta subunit
MSTISKAKNVNVICAGVGGQGVISAVEIMARTAVKLDYPVRTAETHGMAQRGGPVMAYLRFGTEVSGPLMPRGYAHAILAFEPIEAIRILEYAGPETYFFIDTVPILPLSIYQSQDIKYPTIDEIKTCIEKVTKYVFFIDATGIAKKAGNIRTLNTVFLGIVVGSKRLPLEKDVLLETILDAVPSTAAELNTRAFELGFQTGTQLYQQILSQRSNT